MLAPITHILPITTIRRERFLPVAGKVLVRSGQKVNPTDTVAEVNLYPKHQLLDIGRGLGVSVDQADPLMKCQAGDQILKGDVIAGPIGFTRRLIRATHDGKVILAGSGQVLLELAGKPFQLKAGLPGEVVDLVPDRGAIIEVDGGLIQAVWGNGRIDFGLMSVLAQEPEHIITADQLDVSLRGAIIMGGCCQDAEVLKTAEQLPLRGLILSSMWPELVPLAKKLSIPVIITEGLGNYPMNSVAYKLLSTNDRREVAAIAEPWDSYKGTRPEIIIPLPGSERTTAPQEMGYFGPNQQVRVLRAPFVGKIGTILNLINKAEFPSGLKAPAAEVQLETGKKAVLPLANLEILA